MVKIFCWGIFLTGLVLFTNTCSADPTVVDIPWKRTNATTWEKHLGGVGGQATLTARTGAGMFTYSVKRPCLGTIKFYTITWQKGQTLARGTNCAGRSHQEPTAPWLPWFQDLPPAALPPARTV